MSTRTSKKRSRHGRFLDPLYCGVNYQGSCPNCMTTKYSNMLEVDDNMILTGGGSEAFKRGGKAAVADRGPA